MPIWSVTFFFSAAVGGAANAAGALHNNAAGIDHTVAAITKAISSDAGLNGRRLIFQVPKKGSALAEESPHGSMA